MRFSVVGGGQGVVRTHSGRAERQEDQPVRKAVWKDWALLLYGYNNPVIHPSGGRMLSGDVADAKLE